MGLFSAGIVLSAHITFSKAGFIEKTYKPSRNPKENGIGFVWVEHCWASWAG